MGMFDGTAPPNVESTKVTGVAAPQYLTDYLTNLAQAGQTALAKPADQLVAPLSTLQTGAIAAAPTDLNTYKTPMSSALTAGQAGASISPEDISQFYNPYEKAVVDQMATQSATNVQRNLMPQLKAGFVGSGGLGSQRYANALGQTMGDANTALLQEQNKARMSGYQSAIDAALKEQGLQTQAGVQLGNLGTQEQQAASGSLKSQADLGAIEQAQNQAQINAPLTQATNVSALMRGYTYPTTSTETYKGPASSYGPSPIAQIAGMGTLLGSGFNSSSGWGNQLVKGLSGLMSPTAPNVSFAGTNADGTNVYYNSSNGNYTDSSGNVVPITGGEGE